MASPEGLQGQDEPLERSGRIERCVFGESHGFLVGP
jgi:hypothetical protein